jgi:Arc/MetJ family transcription regulator
METFFIANGRGNQSSFYNGLDIGMFSMHIHASKNASWNRNLMRTTINIDDGLIRRAAELTGIREKTSLVKLDLEALIARECGKRLARLGGTEKKLETIPRRRANTK